MATISVVFRNPITGQIVDSTVDDDMTVKEVTESLGQLNFIPLPTIGERYVLYVGGKTELSREEETLASGGIANGDIIVVVRA